MDRTAPLYMGETQIRAVNNEGINKWHRVIGGSSIPW